MSFAFVFIIPISLFLTIKDLSELYSYAYAQIKPLNYSDFNLSNIQNIPFQKVKVGDISIAYKSFGNGEPILLISGSGNVMDVWPLSLLQKLSLNHQVVIFDNRGVGNTTSGIKPFSIEQFTNDTVGLMDVLKIKRADILGFSMASFIAQQLTITHPEKVNRLILYGASCGGQEGIPQSPSVIKSLSDFVYNRTLDVNAFLSVTFPPEYVKKNPNYIQAFPKTSEIIPSSTLIQQFNINEKWLARNWDGVCGQITKIYQPTLIITGTEDVAVPSANSLILVEKIPGAWLAQIKDAGHGLMFQYPEIFSTIVETFLKETPNTVTEIL
ncbi:MAG: alpha/beta hydrolase [Thermoproteota archaeon]|nr:alpha/beta hydrolase [Thermoproteota archaeon]